MVMVYGVLYFRRLFHCAMKRMSKVLNTMSTSYLLFLNKRENIQIKKISITYTKIKNQLIKMDSFN